LDDIGKLPIHANTSVIASTLGITDVSTVCKSQDLPQLKPMTYPEINWKKNEYVHVQEALALLKAISEREAKRHEMDQHLTPSMLALLEDEIIPMIENELDVDYAPDEVGEPPITLDEMHTAAWKEHQAMHS